MVEEMVEWQSHKIIKSKNIRAVNGLKDYLNLIFSFYRWGNRPRGSLMTQKFRGQLKTEFSSFK